MKQAKLSYWNNKWSDVFDFTPQKEGDDLHYSLKHELITSIVKPFNKVKLLFDKLNEDRKALGAAATNLISELNE